MSYPLKKKRKTQMNRIKEIGIYRAIGVTKKNFVFKETKNNNIPKCFDAFKK